VPVGRSLSLLAAAVLVAGCGGDDSGPGAVVATEDGRTLPRVVIEKRDGTSVEVAVELAETQEERTSGLMHRASLPADSGMLFVFEGPSQGGFWMKNTLIPLSIAFVAADGRIARILDMEPCEADPCPVYEPGVPYVQALEVNRGAFGRWGVEEGDELRLER
jgi:uncharacterized protein